MLIATESRKDVDQYLTREVTIKKITATEDNVIYGNETTTETSYSLYIRFNILSSKDNPVKQGLLKEGDALATFRYEYTSEVNGTTINPAITVAEDDEVVVGDNRFRIHEMEAVPDEFGTVICYEAKLVRIK